MLRTIKWTFVLFAVFSYPTFAFSQWVYRKEENAFDEKKSSHVALTAIPDGYALGARCINSSLSIIYVTPEEISDKSIVSLMNMTGAKILFKIDKSPSKEFDVSLDSPKSNLFAVLEDEDAKTVMNDIMAAKERVSIDLKLPDKMFHTNNFSSKNAGA